MTSHPDILELEGLSAGEPNAAVAAHTAACPECAELLADLQRLRNEIPQADAAPLWIPEEIDRRVLWAARRRALEIRRSARPGWGRPTWIATAAAALVAALATVIQIARVRTGDGDSRHPTPVAASVVARSGDVNGDGVVDILDAFALARTLEDERNGVDVDGDGRSDVADVRALAQRAVALGGAS